MAHLPENYDFNALHKQSMHTPTAWCGTCGKEKPRYDLEERYSFGVYAGRYCDDACWARSGYRDAIRSGRCRRSHGTRGLLNDYHSN